MTACHCESNVCSCRLVSESGGETSSGQIYSRNKHFRFQTPAQRDREQIAALRALTQDRRVVYAMEIPGGLIKIGCTINLVNRRNSMRPGPVKILAFVYGEHMDEQAYHRRLKPHLAYGREFYNPTPEVLAVVNEMRDAFGLSHLGKPHHSAPAEPLSVRST